MLVYLYIALTLVSLIPLVQPYSLLPLSRRLLYSTTSPTPTSLFAKPPKPSVDYEDLYPDADAFDKTKPRDGRKYAGKSNKAELKRRLRKEVNIDSDSSPLGPAPPEASPATAAAFSIRVPPPDSVIRLDKHLSHLLPSVSRSFLQSRLSDGAFTCGSDAGVGSAPLTKTSKIRPDQTVLYTPPAAPSSTSSSSSGAAGSPAPMTVLYRSPNIAVLSKPYGALTHVGANNWDHASTVSGEAERLFGIPEGEFDGGAAVGAVDGGEVEGEDDGDDEAEGVAPASPKQPASAFESLFLETLTSRSLRRPGIVHRLDATTTGCIIVASDRPTVGFLSEQFKERRVGKLYLARVKGKMTEVRRLHLPVKRDATDATKMAVGSGGKHSDTIVRPLAFEEAGGTTLVAVVILTGRTHQIRLALAHVGFPIIGDRKYNSRVKAEERVMLHCREVRFEGEGGERVSVKDVWGEEGEVDVDGMVEGWDKWRDETDVSDVVE